MKNKSLHGKGVIESAMPEVDTATKTIITEKVKRSAIRKIVYEAPKSVRKTNDRIAKQIQQLGQDIEDGKWDKYDKPKEKKKK